MHDEILESIDEYCHKGKIDFDEQLYADLLSYLYQTTEDYKMKMDIEKRMDDIQRCVYCGGKQKYYHWEEWNGEPCGVYACPIHDEFKNMEGVKCD